MDIDTYDAVNATDSTFSLSFSSTFSTQYDFNVSTSSVWALSTTPISTTGSSSGKTATMVTLWPVAGLIISGWIGFIMLLLMSSRLCQFAILSRKYRQRKQKQIDNYYHQYRTGTPGGDTPGGIENNKTPGDIETPGGGIKNEILTKYHKDRYKKEQRDKLNNKLMLLSLFCMFFCLFTCLAAGLWRTNFITSKIFSIKINRDYFNYYNYEYCKFSFNSQYIAYHFSRLFLYLLFTFRIEKVFNHTLYQCSLKFLLIFRIFILFSFLLMYTICFIFLRHVVIETTDGIDPIRSCDAITDTYTLAEKVDNFGSSVVVLCIAILNFVVTIILLYIFVSKLRLLSNAMLETIAAQSDIKQKQTMLKILKVDFKKLLIKNYKKRYAKKRRKTTKSKSKSKIKNTTRQSKIKFQHKNTEELVVLKSGAPTTAEMVSINSNQNGSNINEKDNNNNNNNNNNITNNNDNNNDNPNRSIKHKVKIVQNGVTKDDKEHGHEDKNMIDHGYLHSLNLNNSMNSNITNQSGKLINLQCSIMSESRGASEFTDMNGTDLNNNNYELDEKTLITELGNNPRLLYKIETRFNELMYVSMKMTILVSTSLITTCIFSFFGMIVWESYLSWFIAIDCIITGLCIYLLFAFNDQLYRVVFCRCFRNCCYICCTLTLLIKHNPKSTSYARKSAVGAKGKGNSSETFRASHMTDNWRTSVTNTITNTFGGGSVNNSSKNRFGRKKRSGTQERNKLWHAYNARTDFVLDNKSSSDLSSVVGKFQEIELDFDTSISANSSLKVDYFHFNEKYFGTKSRDSRENSPIIDTNLTDIKKTSNNNYNNNNNITDKNKNKNKNNDNNGNNNKNNNSSNITKLVDSGAMSPAHHTHDLKGGENVGPKLNMTLSGTSFSFMTAKPTERSGIRGSDIIDPIQEENLYGNNGQNNGNGKGNGGNGKGNGNGNGNGGNSNVNSHSKMAQDFNIAQMRIMDTTHAEQFDMMNMGRLSTTVTGTMQGQTPSAAPILDAYEYDDEEEDIIGNLNINVANMIGYGNLDNLVELSSESDSSENMFVEMSTTNTKVIANDDLADAYHRLDG